MFERIGQAAETLAIHFSRRNFLGWIGKSGLAVAGLLAIQSASRAQYGGGGCNCKHNEYCCNGVCAKHNQTCIGAGLAGGALSPGGPRRCPQQTGRGCTNGKQNQLCCDGHWV
jgi:hypothetical protein